jgi:hypothetical protein
MDTVAPNISRYFSISTNTDYRSSPIVLQQEESKTQSAQVFLRLLDNKLRDGAIIRSNETGRSLREIVTSIVSGYEAKRGIFLRIWECILYIFGYSTDTQEIIDLSESILQVELIQDTYPPAFFTQQTQGIIDFLFNLPQEAAQDFFTKQLREEGKLGADENPVFAYCNSHDFSRPRDIHDLPARDCITFAKEVSWYFRAYESVFPRSYGSSRKQPTFPINPALFQGLEECRIDTISRSLDGFLLTIARAADLENDIQGAAGALSQVYSAYNNVSLILGVVNKCLEHNDIISAYTAVLTVYLENKDDILLNIGNAALKMSMTKNHFDILLSIALESNHMNDDSEKFRINFVNACVDQEFYEWAVLAVHEMGEQRYFSSRDAGFEKIFNAHIKNKNCEAAKEKVIYMSQEDAVSERIVLKTIDIALEAKDYVTAVNAVTYVRQDAHYRIDLLKKIATFDITDETVKNTIQKEIAKYEAEAKS